VNNPIAAASGSNRTPATLTSSSAAAIAGSAPIRTASMSTRSLRSDHFFGLSSRPIISVTSSLSAFFATP